jgi:hypothetical protein
MDVIAHRNLAWVLGLDIMMQFIRSARQPAWTGNDLEQRAPVDRPGLTIRRNIAASREAFGSALP